MRAIEVSRTVQIPEDAEPTVDGRKFTVRGAKGTLSRDFAYAPVKIELQERSLRIWADWPSKKEAALVGTIASHVQNMITGVSKGFTYKVKMVFSHFPISVKVKDGSVLIENFTGERNPRQARIIGSSQVKIQGEDVIVQGINLEDVSQTAANVEQATKVKRKDPRIFLDGLYVYERIEAME